MAHRQDHADPRDEMDDYNYANSLSSGSVVHDAFDWGIIGSITAIIVLTFLYTLAPADFLPDIVPVTGQVDDLAAILAGGSSVTLLAGLRYLLRSRIGHWGCLAAIILSATGAFAFFWVLMQVLDRLL